MVMMIIFPLSKHVIDNLLCSSNVVKHRSNVNDVCYCKLAIDFGCKSIYCSYSKIDVLMLYC